MFSSITSATLLNLGKPVSTRASFLTRVPPAISLSRNDAKQSLRQAHTVRVIVTQDVSNGKLYKDDIVDVAAGYARNYLIPQKLAVYATRQNFAKFEIRDPSLESVEELRARLAREAEAGEDQDLKAADLLRFYLRNKVLKIWRNIEASNAEYNAISPGVVDAMAVRRKLSKQLNIDLEEHEKVHLFKDHVNHAELLTDRQLEPIMQLFGENDARCQTQIKHLGEYIARVSLRGGYSIPLKLEVLKR